MTKKYWIIGVVGLIVLIGAYMIVEKTSDVTFAPAGDQTGTSTQSVSTTTPEEGGAASQTQTGTPQFAISKSDTIASWNFKGTYDGNITLQTQGNADIEKLTDLLGKGTYDDYDLYNGIANDYTFLGNGNMAYHYYNIAIAIHPNKGLAYMNLGHLMSELGATQTAINAFEKSVANEPAQEAYWVTYLNFLTTTQPTSSLTSATFARALKATNSSSDILIKKANWQEDMKQYSASIATWRQVRPLVAPDQQTAIDAKIKKLQEKL